MAKARRARSAKQTQAARRNITKAHLARYRTKEPRSIGRVRPVRRPPTLVTRRA